MSKMMTLKGVFPDTKSTKSKNFIRENVKNIRRISLQSNKEDKNKSDKNKNKPINSGSIEKTDKGIESANDLFSKNSTTQQKLLIQDHINRKQSNMINKAKKNTSKSNIDLLKTSSDSNIDKKRKRNSSSLSINKTNYISRGIQTSFSNDCLDSIESPIFPSQSMEEVNTESLDKIIKLKENIKNCTINDEHKNEIDNDTLSPKQSDNQISFENNLSCFSNSTNNISHQINKYDIKASKSTVHSKNKPVVSTHRLGVVPKYLVERKEALLREKQEKNIELTQPVCPEGHILLPDKERKDTLSMLKKSYQDCINELNKLPIRSDTLRAHKKKMELEEKLNKLEEGIKVFSRPKVFVKINS